MNAPTLRGDPAAPGLVFAATTVGYGGRPVVSSVDLQVDRGEFVGLIGPNGAGKSTLLKAITGAAVVTAGSVTVTGIDLPALDSGARARIVAVVPQALPTLFAFTAREFVTMGRHPHLGRLERTSQRDGAVVHRAMEMTDTFKLADERVDTLSGGDLQRLTLAQALAQEPDVLLLDEPTSHLDLNHRLQVLDLVRERADGGLAVLGVFHDLDLAARYSDRIAVVHGGTVGSCGPPHEVLTSALLREVFEVRAVVGTDAVTGSVSVTPVLREQSAPEVTRGTVFVVGGSGAAAPLMRRLALAGYRVTSGALNVGDIDLAVADALGLQFVKISAFAQMDASSEAAVRELAVAADVRVVAPVPFGHSNLGNLRAVVQSAGPTVFVGGFDEDRDFAGGAAFDLAQAALEAGAVVANDIDDALALICDTLDA
ncbi:MAG: ABC transporter ATP-binding protein [Coriobacteriia bacterium]